MAINISNEQDPITGKPLPRLSNYNGSEQTGPGPSVLPRLTRRPASDVKFEASEIGSTGDIAGFDYTATKYDNPEVYQNDLDDLDDMRANNQGSLKALANSVPKFIGKTATNVIGGIAGTIYGVGSAVANGEMSKVWDNALMDKLDSLDKGIDDMFKVYKNSDYEDQNILQRAFLHPTQFISDATDALSFTAGAIVSEYLTAGLASNLILPKALKYLKGLGRGAEAAEATAQLTGAANKLTKGLGDGGRLLRQLATGAAYESAVEARQATMELREKLVSDWEEANPGVAMSEADRDAIDERLSDAGAFTYLTNLALVGSSNIMQFPKIFGIGNKVASTAAGKVVRDAESGAYKSTVKELGIGGKILYGLKNPASEGLYEEGLQSVTSGTAVDYFGRKNDDKSKSNVDQFLNAFTKNLSETYTTKAGWNEIGMGMLIGGLGAPGRGALAVFGKNNKLGQYAYEDVLDDTGQKVGVKRREIWDGGVVGGVNEYNADREEIASIVDSLNAHTSLPNAMKANYDFLVQNDSLEKDKERAINAGDIFNFENAKDDQIHAYVSSRIKAGLYEDMTSDVENMRKMSDEEFFKTFRGDQANEQTSEVDKANFKQDTIAEFIEKAKNTKEAYEIADEVYQGGNEDFREELVHSIAASKNLDSREKAVNRKLGKLSNGSIGIAELPYTGREGKDNLVSTATEVQKNGLTLLENDMMEMFKQTDPIRYTVNEKQIKNLLKDSRKIRAKRQDYIDLFNTLFTKEGQAQFDKLYEEVAAQKVRDDVAKFKEAEEAEVKKRQQEVKKKVDETPVTAEPVIEEEESDELVLEEATYEPEEAQPVSVPTPSVNQPTPEEKAVAAVVEQEETNKGVKETKEDGLVIQPLEGAVAVNKAIDIDEDKFKRSVGNTIISLNINYIENGDKIYDVFDKDGNLEINSSFDSRLQDPDQFTTGNRVTMRIPTYAEMKATGSGYTNNKYISDSGNVGSLPIAFFDSNDKIIGYLPTQDNIVKRVKKENINTELAKNMALRQKVLDNKDGAFEVTITGKSNGTLLATNKSDSLYKMLGNGSKLAPGVTISIYKDSRLQTSLGSNFNDSIINKDELKSGHIYAIVPTATKGNFVATAMDISPIGESGARSILKALQLFRAGDKDSRDKPLLDKREAIANEIDLSNPIEFDKLISSIIYKSSDNDAYMFRTDKGKLILGTTPDMTFTRDQVMYDANAQQRIVDILAKRYHAVQLSQFGRKFNQFNEDGTISRHNDYLDYLNKNEVVKTNIQGVPIEGSNKMYFTAQSVIEFSNPKEIGRVTYAAPKVKEAIEVIEDNNSPLDTFEKLIRTDGAKFISFGKEVTIKTRGTSGFTVTGNDNVLLGSLHSYDANDPQTKILRDNYLDNNTNTEPVVETPKDDFLDRVAKVKNVEQDTVYTPVTRELVNLYREIFNKPAWTGEYKDYMKAIEEANSNHANTFAPLLNNTVQAKEYLSKTLYNNFKANNSTTEAPKAVPKNKLGIKYKPKNTPQINDDIDFINRLESIKDLDKQAEELMKKCSG